MTKSFVMIRKPQFPYSGNNNGVYDAGDMGSQVVRVFYADQINQIDEIRLDGVLKFDEGHFDFGVQARAMENKTSLRRITWRWVTGVSQPLVIFL